MSAPLSHPIGQRLPAPVPALLHSELVQALEFLNQSRAAVDARQAVLAVQMRVARVVLVDGCARLACHMSSA